MSLNLGTGRLLVALALAASFVVAGCGSSSDAASSADSGTATADASDTAETGDTESSDTESSDTESSDTAESSDTETGDTDEAGDTDENDGDQSAAVSTFQIDVWADNWMAVYVDGSLIGEDSVPITTERSFNAESFTFEAAYPFTLAIEAKDFKETDSGLEYIGENNQQMGDGGLIAQVTDVATGEVVAVTSGDWSALVVHRAPLNTDCENDSDPDATCEYEISETPTDWAAPSFDASDWSSATEWSAADVDPKLGYDEINWASDAALIWGSDLEVDNTILFRTDVTG